MASRTNLQSVWVGLRRAPFCSRAMLRCGKHKGLTFEDACADREYCAWVLRLSQPSPSLRRFANYLREHHGGVLEIGRHRGAFFDEMLTNRSYCEWAMDLAAPSTPMRKFAEYVRRVHDGDDDSSSSETIDYSDDPRKRARLDTGVSERRVQDLLREGDTYVLRAVRSHGCLRRVCLQGPAMPHLQGVDPPGR